MRLLLTRPREDSARLSEELTAEGHDCLIAPVLEERPIPERLDDLARYQAILITSARGVRALAERTPIRDCPVYTVGARGRAVAEGLGFAAVESADGDSKALVNLIKKRCDPENGPLLHACGRDRAGDPAGDLRAAGYTVDSAVLYEMIPAESLPEDVREALAGRTLDAALFFSPRSAETFVSLVREAGLEASVGALGAVCLSEAVASELTPADWRWLRVAERPDWPSMKARLTG